MHKVKKLLLEFFKRHKKRLVKLLGIVKLILEIIKLLKDLIK